jgi:hypothetical protein
MRRPSWRSALPIAALLPAAIVVGPRLVRRAKPATRALLARSPARLGGQERVTPAILAGELWGGDEANSHSPGAQRVRTAARDLFPKQAPGHGGEWRFTDSQVAKLKAHLEER